MSKRPDPHKILVSAQPVNWGRAFVVGFFAVSMMMAFVDIFTMMGLTPFSFETYIGSLFTGMREGSHNWTVGVLANWLIGGVFGIFYGYIFEYAKRRADVRAGLFVSLIHILVAAVILFPFFNLMHNFSGIKIYPSFGLLGSGLNLLTPLLIIASHLIFGATMGALYGPVRADRLRTRSFEPGELLRPGDPRAITEEDSPEDRVAI